MTARELFSFVRQTDKAMSECLSICPCWSSLVLAIKEEVLKMSQEFHKTQGKSGTLSCFPKNDDQKPGRRKVVDACSPLRCFAANVARLDSSIPFLRWREEWCSTAGRGVVAGLLDTCFDEKVSDLAGANLETQNFSGSEKYGGGIIEHGTHSVTTLVGQGHSQIYGIAPEVQLLAAQVVGANGIASPKAVVEAIDWVISRDAQIVILPIGERIERPEVTQRIEKGAENGVLFFAAAGNDSPEPVVFPARHPLVIAVGAADRNGSLLPDCSTRPWLDLVAPGWKIAAPVRNDIIQQRSGSSVACVLAAGAAILALSANAFLPNQVHRTSMLETLRFD